MVYIKFHHLISHPASLIFSCLLPSPQAIETPFFLLSPDFCNCSICQETSLQPLQISLSADQQAEASLHCTSLLQRQKPQRFNLVLSPQVATSIHSTLETPSSQTTNQGAICSSAIPADSKSIHTGPFLSLIVTREKTKTHREALHSQCSFQCICWAIIVLPFIYSTFCFPLIPQSASIINIIIINI